MNKKAPPGSNDNSDLNSSEIRAAKDAFDLIEKAAPMGKLKDALKRAKQSSSDGAENKTNQNEKRRRRQF